jgi:hypothetical protein
VLLNAPYPDIQHAVSFDLSWCSWETSDQDLVFVALASNLFTALPILRAHVSTASRPRMNLPVLEVLP